MDRGGWMGVGVAVLCKRARDGKVCGTGGMTYLSMSVAGRTVSSYSCGWAGRGPVITESELASLGARESS